MHEPGSKFAWLWICISRLDHLHEAGQLQSDQIEWNHKRTARRQKIRCLSCSFTSCICISGTIRMWNIASKVHVLCFFVCANYKNIIFFVVSPNLYTQAMWLRVLNYNALGMLVPMFFLLGISLVGSWTSLGVVIGHDFCRYKSFSKVQSWFLKWWSEKCSALSMIRSDVCIH